MTGKNIINNYAILKVDISRYNSNIDPNCFSEQLFQSVLTQLGGKFMMKFEVVKPIVNPDNKEAVDYTLEDSILMPFDCNVVMFAAKYIGKDIIETD